MNLKNLMKKASGKMKAQKGAFVDGKYSGIIRRTVKKKKAAK